MDDALLALGPLVLTGWNALLWFWSRAYVRYAAVSMFALNLLVGSPLFGVLCWNLLGRDVETSYAGSLGDAFVAIGLGLFNVLLSLIGVAATAMRRAPDAAQKRKRDRDESR
ncbi:hypothetical protein J5226_20390 [Lysobacter sp. K5869]|uniref:hypothetical protein n=1 Tax=Lysobacter sp. K5869 TaxID=2820808 RepID=UPI001C05F87F|nr:hypothetical protein [Lysobacter sp. K5869]QWP75940.1 hypothetical protein J5226_20390 [Lysobacter sp. K5869]